MPLQSNLKDLFLVYCQGDLEYLRIGQMRVGQAQAYLAAVPVLALVLAALLALPPPAPLPLLPPALPLLLCLLPLPRPLLRLPLRPLLPRTPLLRILLPLPLLRPLLPLLLSYLFLRLRR